MFSWLEAAVAILAPVHFRMNFGITLPVSSKTLARTFIKMALHLSIWGVGEELLS